MCTVSANAPVSPPPAPGRRSASLAGLGAGGWVSIGVLVLVLLTAALGPLLAPHDPNAVDLSNAYGGPTPDHILGFDSSGRDLFSRLIVGARTAIVGPLLVVTFSTILGVTLALTAVWVGGWLDAVVARFIDAIFAFPGLLLAILAAALFGSGLRAAVAALTIAYTPYLARIVRGAALRERSLPYVAALQVQGFRGTTVCLRHILPNLRALVVANATLAFGLALIDLAALSFIGLGVQPPTADWGTSVANGMTGILSGYPQEAIYASALIVATVAAANVLGDRISARAEAQS